MSIFDSTRPQRIRSITRVLCIIVHIYTYKYTHTLIKRTHTHTSIFLQHTDPGAFDPSHVCIQYICKATLHAVDLE